MAQILWAKEGQATLPHSPLHTQPIHLLSHNANYPKLALVYSEPGVCQLQACLRALKVVPPIEPMNRQTLIRVYLHCFGCPSLSPRTLLGCGRPGLHLLTLDLGQQMHLLSFVGGAQSGGIDLIGEILM